MDFQRLFNHLCENAQLREMGLRRDEEARLYVKGVFDTLETLELMANYNRWCRENDILVEGDEVEINTPKTITKCVCPTCGIVMTVAPRCPECGR